MERSLTYSEAIWEATFQEMERDSSVILFGMGVDDPKGVFGTTKGLLERFGRDRVFDTPLAEDTMTGVAIGAALAGLRPIHVHIRMDFLLLAMNQLVNIAAKTRYMFGGRRGVPMVVRAIIGRSWGQGAQHSQALHSFFMHVPGLKVVAPTTPRDAKGCLIHSIRDDDPVIFVEERILHYQKGFVPEESFTLPPGKARILAEGKDVTIVGISHMVVECLRAREFLAEVGINAEILDPVWLSPLDIDTIEKSALKTGRLLVVDNAWLACGASAEILARVTEGLNSTKEMKVRRLGFEPVTCPPTPSLEKIFYPSAKKIATVAHAMVKNRNIHFSREEEVLPEVAAFRGPF